MADFGECHRNGRSRSYSRPFSLSSTRPRRCTLGGALLFHGRRVASPDRAWSGPCAPPFLVVWCRDSSVKSLLANCSRFAVVWRGRDFDPRWLPRPGVPTCFQDVLDARPRRDHGARRRPCASAPPSPDAAPPIQGRHVSSTQDTSQHPECRKRREHHKRAKGPEHRRRRKYRERRKCRWRSRSWGHCRLSQ